MSENRLPDYLDHMLEAARLACSFVENISKDDFLADKRTQQAVILNIIIIGEAATKLLQSYGDFLEKHPELPWRNMKGMRNRVAHGYSTSILIWCGRLCRQPCRSYWSSCLPLAKTPAKSNQT